MEEQKIYELSDNVFTNKESIIEVFGDLMGGAEEPEEVSFENKQLIIDRCLKNEWERWANFWSNI